MLGTVLDRLVTLVRPDRAELIPTVDFDRENGQLDVLLEVSVRGRSIPIRSGLVTKGFGTIGARTFRFPTGQVATFKRALKYLEWLRPNRLRASGESVPNCLKILREGFPLRESERARAVTLRDAGVAAYVDAQDSQALTIEVAGAADQGQTFPLSIKDLKTGTVHREGTTFYKIEPLSGETFKLLGDGTLDHKGSVGRVRQLTSDVLDRLRAVMTVRLSGSAEMLLTSANRPAEAKLIPSVEFSPYDGILGIRLHEVSSTGQHPVHDLKKLDEVHLVAGRFVETDKAGRHLLEQLVPMVHTTQGDVLQVVGGAVPEALRVLRLQPDLRESETAKTIQIHDVPLEQ